MPTIKRYPNRKLYDTDQKKYITLEGIAELIQAGEEVQVVDHTTGEDLTAVTLSQIIFEQEKKQGGFLPKTVLTGLVRSGGDTFNALKRTMALPLGLSHETDEEISRRIDYLVEQGELSPEAGETLLEKLLGAQPSGEQERPSENYLKAVLSKQGIPSRDEIEQLSNQIDALAAKLENLGSGKSNSPQND